MIYNNEEMINKTNEHIITEMRRELAIGNYKGFDFSFARSKEYERLLLDMTRSKQIKSYNRGLKSETMAEINRKGQAFISSITDGINTKVPYIDIDPRDESLEIQFYEIEGENTLNNTNYLDFMKFALKKSKRIDVAKIEPKYSIKSRNNGWSAGYLPYKENIDLKILRKTPYICLGIGMENQGDEISFSVLVHEYTHALVNRHKGIIENCAHNELLSIFLELLAVHEQEQSGKLLNVALTARLEGIRESVLRLNLEKQLGFVEDYKAVYIDSTIYAMDLLDMYIHTSINGKKAILNEIKKTLAGDRTLEDTLEKLGASEERGSQIMRTQVKTLLK